MQVPQSKTCFDQLINSQTSKLPKNQSFIKPPLPNKGIVSETTKGVSKLGQNDKPVDPKEEIRHQKKLQKT